MWTHRALWEVCCFPGACPPNAAHSWPRSVVVTAATRTCLHCCGPVGSRKWWDILCGVPAGVAHLGSPGAHCNDSSCRWLGLEEEDAHSVLLFWVKGSLQSTQCRMICFKSVHVHMGTCDHTSYLCMQRTRIRQPTVTTEVCRKMGDCHFKVLTCVFHGFYHASRCTFII